MGYVSSVDGKLGFPNLESFFLLILLPWRFCGVFLSFCGWIGVFSVVFFGKRGLGLGWGGLPAGRCAEIRSSTFVFWAFRRDDFFHKMIPEWLLLFATSIFLDHISLSLSIYINLNIYIYMYLYIYIYIYVHTLYVHIQKTNKYSFFKRTYVRNHWEETGSFPMAGASPSGRRFAKDELELCRVQKGFAKILGRNRGEM